MSNFAARLDELMKAVDKRRLNDSYSFASQIDFDRAESDLARYVINRAPAIRDLARAAEEWEAAKHESEGMVTTREQLDRLYRAERKVTVALAKLEEA